MKAVAYIFAILLCIFGCFAIEQPPQLSCDTAVMYNIEYDKMIYQKDTEKEIYPASFTKIMTAVIALENADKPESIEVTDSALQGLTGNYIGLKSGEIVQYDELVKALIVAGANDAALVLAQNIGVTVDGFVDLMNDKAKQLGMSNTHFTNPTGMHDAYMKTTIGDILILCKYAYGINEYMEISSLPKYDMLKTNKSPVRSLITRNLMQSRIFGGDYYDKNIRGMNSGSTSEAGFCLATTKEKDGLVYICIVSGSEKDEDGTIGSYIDTSLLYDYTFDNFTLTEVISASSSICQVPVKFSGSIDNTVVVSEKSLKTILPIDADLKSGVQIEKRLDIELLEAPIKSGQVVGNADVYYNQQLIGTVPIITQSNIERSNFLYLVNEIGNFFKRREVILTILAVIAAIIIYAIALILHVPKRRK